MSGGGRRSAGPPMSKFCSDLEISGEQTGPADKGVYKPLGLRAPVPIRRDLEVTKRVLLGSEFLLGLEAKKNIQQQSQSLENRTHHE